MTPIEKTFIVLRYSACIRPEAGMCCIRYQVCPDQTNAFSLSSGLLAGDSGKMSQIDTQCSATHDYVLIEGTFFMKCKHCILFLFNSEVI